MSNITLREYHLFIDDLLERNAISEAIVHCTNILSSFPKSIKTYQQLGQALLEQKRYSDAAEVFLKVLSVYPDDFVAHAGLSVVHEENYELDKAIWHMEQAFETQPSNSAIQEEFRRLISRRDGTIPSKIRLTRGALIRMYAKGELYQQAIAESLSALQADKERNDIKLLLARMYMLTNADSLASEICVEILKDHPYCYEANRIMFELSSTGSDPEAYKPLYLQRLSELDPYYGFITTASENVDEIPTEKILLDQPEYLSREEDYSRSPEWADKIGIPWHDDSEDAVTNNAQTRPLDEASDDDMLSELLTPTPFIEEEVSPIDSETPTAAALQEHPETALPEWIAKAGWVRANEDEQPTTSIEPDEESSIDETHVEAEEPAQPADSLPDWLQSIQTEGADSPQLFSSSEGEEIPEAVIPPLPPEMLAELLSEESEPFANLPVSFDSSENTPQEAAEPSVENKSFEIPISTGDEPVPDLPDWLKDLEVGATQIPEEASAVSLGDKTHEPVSEPGSTTIEITDFLSEIETSDLVGDLEDNAEDIIINDEVSQPVPDELSDFELNFESIKTESTDQLIFQEEPGLEITEAEEVVPSAEKPVGPVLSEPELEVAERKEPELFEAEPVEVESSEPTSRPSIPAWVRNILGEPADSTPTISTAPSIGVTPEMEISAAPVDSEEIIEELITDLPDEPIGAGAISGEVTAELETWLQEVDSEEADKVTADQETAELPDSNKEMPEITFASMLESAELEESQELVAEIENELQAEEAAFDDRLSSLLGAGEEPLPEAIVNEVEKDEIVQADIVRVVNLLQSGDFSSFTQEITNLPLEDEVSEQVIAELSSTLESYPENIELWQDMGDLLSKKASFDEALNAYREAEKNILL